MELPDIEPSADLLARAIAELFDFKFADLVSQRLPRHGDVTIDLVDDVILRLRCVIHKVGNRALSVPLHVMHSGINHQADGAPHFVSKLAEL